MSPKAERQRIDAFELWWWRRLLTVPWTARRSNQSILKEISSEYSLEGLVLKLKLQYFGHLMWRTDSLEKTLMLGKIEGSRRRDNRGWDGWMASPTRWTWVWVSSGSWWRTGKSGMLQSMGSQRVGHEWVTELNWTEKPVCGSKSNRTRHRTEDWLKIGRGVRQGCISSPCWFNLYAEYIIWKARLDELQAGIKIARKNTNNLRYADDTSLLAESKEELKSLLMRVKEESEMLV